MKRYECKKCKSIHYVNGSAFMQHLKFRSELGVFDGPPPPPIVLPKIFEE